jgi:two-component sensor histidine kinase
MQAAFAEKAVLLKEVHHRVKNSLQIICSLLELQSDYIRDAEFSSHITESRNRISAMALIHQRLYQSEHFACLDFAEYITSLVPSLISSCGKDPGRVSLTMDVGDSSDVSVRTGRKRTAGMKHEKTLEH